MKGNIKDSKFWRAAEYATSLDYVAGSGDWWKALRHGLSILGDKA